MRKKIKGKDLMLFAGGKTIALATSCSITINTETEESSTKDNGGNKDYEITAISWSASSESICGAEENSPVDKTYEDLMDLQLSKTKATILFGLVATNNTVMPDAGWTAPAKGYSGEAIIESVSINAPNEGNATLSVSFKGCGTLSKVTQQQAPSQES